MERGVTSLGLDAVTVMDLGKLKSDSDLVSKDGKNNAAAGDVFRDSREVVEKLLLKGMQQLDMSMLAQLLLAFSAGSFMCIGAAVAMALSEGVEALGPRKLLQSMGFLFGFMAIFITSSIYFTEVNILIPQLLWNSFDRFVFWKQFKFWVFVWCGNLLGTLFASTLLVGAGVITPSVAEITLEVLVGKLRYSHGGVGGWFQCLLSAMLCNWAIGMAALGAAKSRIIVSTVFLVFFAVMTFAVLRLEHALANMSLFFLWLVYAGMNGIPSPSVTWGDAFLWSIFPSSLGNVLGGALLLSTIFHFAWSTSWQNRSCCRRSRSSSTPEKGGDIALEEASSPRQASETSLDALDI